MKTKTIPSGLVLLALSWLAHADVAMNYQAENDFFGDSPIVLTVSRMHKPLADAPASVTVIDREMIRNSGARQIADVFRLVPGFVVGYLNGNSPVVTYHGLGQRFHRQMQVLIDGRSVFIPSFGGVPWSNLPLLLEDIERIEVTRGPNAVTYGANAFLATINIITRHAAEDLGGKLVATGELDGDTDASDFYFRYGNQHQNLDWRISAGREKDDGFNDAYDSKVLEKLNFRTDFVSGQNQFWTVQAGVNNSVLGRGEGSETDQFRDEDATNSYQNIKWELIQDDVSTSVLLTHTRQDVDDSFQAQLNDTLADQLGIPAISALPPFFLDISFDRVSERTDLELFQNRQLTEQTKLVYGASVRKDKVKSLYLFNDEDYHKVDTERLFSSLEWKSNNNLTVDLGLMLEDTNFTDQESSFRLSLIQKIDQHNLRFVTSTAKRNPILWEIIGNTQFSTVVPAIPAAPPPFDTPTAYTLVHTLTDGEVEPETIESMEIGLFSEYLDRQLTTDIKFFSYRITEQIDLRKEQDILFGFPQDYYVAVNDDETRVDGIELGFNFSPRDKDYRLYGGASLPRVESFDDKFENSVPDYTAFVGGHVNLQPDHQLSASYYLVDEISWWDYPSEKIDTYQKLDLRYQYTIDRKNDINLELIGYNLIEDFAEYLEQRLQEKSILLRISGRF
ncbi:MAG: TonB-dependent receptor [Gammaproteobacteria bacterium]|nr:TonB-dependent receptor [Gammaproteobacteria bacterium]